MTNRELRQLLAEAASELSKIPLATLEQRVLGTRLLDAEAELYKRAEAGKGNTLTDEDPLGHAGSRIRVRWRARSPQCGAVVRGSDIAAVHEKNARDLYVLWDNDGGFVSMDLLRSDVLLDGATIEARS